MRKWYGYVIFLLLGQACQSAQVTTDDWLFLQSDSVQLAAPVIALPSPFFEKSTLIPIRLAVDGVRLSYELKSGDDFAQGDYKNPLSVSDDFYLRVQAHHPQFQSSAVSTAEGLRIDNCLNYQILSATPAPSEQYPGDGWKTLHDKTKGSTDHQQKTWLGFDGQEIQIDVALEKTVAQFSCTVSCLVNQHSWIFAPEKIEVLASSDGKNFTAPLLLQTDRAMEGPIAFYFPKLNGTFADCRFLRIKIKALSQIPAWHPGTGNPAWVFIDEILIKE